MPPAQNKTPSAPTLLAVVCVACCALAVQQASCRRVHRCFLARKLREAGFDRYHILHYLRRRLVGYYVWAETGLLRKGPGYGRYIRLVYRVLCVANMVSKFNMTMQVKREGGQRTVGIFQLASQFFCFDNYKPGMRNGRCHELCDGPAGSRNACTARCPHSWKDATTRTKNQPSSFYWDCYNTFLFKQKLLLCQKKNTCAGTTTLSTHSNSSLVLSAQFIYAQYNVYSSEYLPTQRVRHQRLDLEL
ncbi:uncharacterized protein LOC142580010 isoform X3 [Dermacentor variabilis]|uniref:uncharacterized protein LOC142580010 isoform X3 n=1 Tax=Dermacentor variabilis TaxID=34621 RepID=UPI003F5C9A24